MVAMNPLSVSIVDFTPNIPLYDDVNLLDLFGPLLGVVVGPSLSVDGFSSSSSDSSLLNDGGTWDLVSVFESLSLSSLLAPIPWTVF